jgi:DNA polymerase I-like protein with 3'-5' exonuclease and polymerase domains
MRFVCSFDVAGTKSYRLSSRKLFGDYGGNAQNIPESIREYLVADPDHVILQVDQSGAEALIVAYLCRPGFYRELFDVGIKPHTFLALNIFTNKFQGEHPPQRYQFRRPIELSQLPEWKSLNKLISKDPGSETEYKLGKLTAHAKAYDMKAPTFRLNVLQKSQGAIILSLDEARRFLDTYDKLFPEILEWQAEVESEVSKSRVLYNLFGYPRIFAGRWCNELVREAYSFVPQSTVGCLTSIAAAELQAETEKQKWRCDLLANVHDALVVQCHKNIVHEVAAFIQKSFGRPLTSPRGETFSMKSEAMFGPTWAKSTMEEIK